MTAHERQARIAALRARVHALGDTDRQDGGTVAPAADAPLADLLANAPPDERAALIARTLAAVEPMASLGFSGDATARLRQATEALTSWWEQWTQERQTAARTTLTNLLDDDGWLSELGPAFAQLKILRTDAEALTGALWALLPYEAQKDGQFGGLDRDRLTRIPEGQRYLAVRSILDAIVEARAVLIGYPDPRRLRLVKTRR